MLPIESYALQVTYLKESEARELIVQPVEAFPDIYEPDAIDAILTLTHCQPFLIQLMCYELVELLNQTKQLQVTVQDVYAIVPIVLSRGDRYFNELWNNTLSLEDRTLLQRLIRGASLDQIGTDTWRRLIQKEILEKTATGYQFQVPLIQKFIEQT